MLAVRWYQASSLVWKGASERRTRGQDFFAGLDEALGPACLLGFEGGHFDGEFGGALDVLQVFELPAFELGAVAEVGVFGEGVVLPAAGFVDGLRDATCRRCR